MIGSFVFARCNSSFVFQIPRRWLALRVGGARLFGASVIIALLFTMFTQP